MASSTTKPTEMVMAIKERLSRLYPRRYMAPKVPARASGTVTLAMNVGQKRRRKRNITRMTRAMLKSRENWTSSTEARIVTVRSLKATSLMAGGSQRSSWGRAARIWSTVSMTLAPACFCTIRRTALLVPAQPASRSFSTPSTTRPTASRRSGIPCRWVRINGL